MRVGITGAAGFIGYNTYQYLKYATEHNPVALKRDFWDDPRIKDCSWIIHLAGMNRGKDEDVFNTNIELAIKLRDAISKGTTVIVASSTQANDRSTAYAKSKREVESILANHVRLRIPNVFGPFCKPNYNSFVATFCHKLCNDEEPEIINDGTVQLIHVSELIYTFVDIINNAIFDDELLEDWQVTGVDVSEVLEQLKYYKDTYLTEGRIPTISDNFEKDLFNTFVNYIPKDKRLIDTVMHSDDRGDLTEIVKVDGSEGQVFFSTTNPGFTRGNHVHFRKFERFCVIDGEAIITLRRIGEDSKGIQYPKLEYKVSGDKIQFIDMPVGYTHSIKNIGKNILTTVFWISELYDEDDPDTYFEEV